MIVRRTFFQRLFGGIAATAFVATADRSDGKPPRESRSADASPSPASNQPAKKNTVAKLRLWRASDAPDQPLQIRFLIHGKPDSAAVSPFKIETGNYQFTNFVDVPAGPMTAEITAPGRPAVLVPFFLADDSQSTLLIRAQGASTTAEWIDDNPGTVDGGCEFGIYNLLPASGDVQIDLGTILTVHLSSARSSLRLTGIKKANYQATINGTDGAGKNFRWNTDVDFRQCRKAALLIFPDLYGRVRPRINSL